MTRRSLPNRRNGFTQKMRVGSHTIYLRTGEYDDGTLGEIFIDASRQGTLLRGMLNAFAISISIGLQNGVSLRSYTRAFLGMKFPPRGPAVAGTPDDPDRVVECHSIPDLLMRELVSAYLGESSEGEPVEEEDCTPEEIL